MWPKKADIYIVRTDGMSCSRETVKGESPSTPPEIALQILCFVIGDH
jgi:hypothetical protein